MKSYSLKCILTARPQFTLCCHLALSNCDQTCTHRCLIEANGCVPGGMSSGLNRWVVMSALVGVRVCAWGRSERVHCLCRAIESCDFTSSDAALLQNKLRTWEEIFQRQVLNIEKHTKRTGRWQCYPHPHYYLFVNVNTIWTTSLRQAGRIAASSCSL